MSQGPTQRDQNGVVYRKGGGRNSASLRANRREPSDEPVFYRETKSNFLMIQELELAYPSRAAFFREAVQITAQITKIGKELKLDDRQEITKRAIEAFKCLLKIGPIPEWVPLEGGYDTTTRKDPCSSE